MKLKYIGSETLRINNYGDVANNGIIEREDLVKSLMHRSDFKVINQVVKQEGKKKTFKKGVKNA